MSTRWWLIGWLSVLLGCTVDATGVDDDDTGTAATSTGSGGSGQGGATSAVGATTGSGGGQGGSGAGAPGPTGCTAQGLALIAEVNAYRVDNGLAALPASSSMCIVSELHVADLADHAPHTGPGDCNLHSWSDQGSWSACCYTSDHAQAQCMWDKPGELSAYPGNGYEIAASGVGTPDSAVNAWSGSPGHNDVMLNQGTWNGFPWGAMGAAIDDGFAVVWFGQETDPMP